MTSVNGSGGRSAMQKLHHLGLGVEIRESAEKTPDDVAFMESDGKEIP